MKKRKETNAKQTELFLESVQASGPVVGELPSRQRLELEQAVAELLLALARNNQRQTGGSDNA